MRRFGSLFLVVGVAAYCLLAPQIAHSSILFNDGFAGSELDTSLWHVADPGISYGVADGQCSITDVSSDATGPSGWHEGFMDASFPVGRADFQVAISFDWQHVQYQWLRVELLRDDGTWAAVIAMIADPAYYVLCQNYDGANVNIGTSAQGVNTFLLRRSHDTLDFSWNDNVRLRAANTESVNRVRLNFGRWSSSEFGTISVDSAVGIGPGCRALVVTDKPERQYLDLLTSVGILPTFSQTYNQLDSSYRLVVVDRYASSTSAIASLLKPFVFEGGNVLVTEGNPLFMASPDFYEWFGANSYTNSGGIARVVTDNPLGTGLTSGEVLDDQTGHGFSFGAVDNLAASAVPVARWADGTGPVYSFYNTYGSGKVYYTARLNTDTTSPEYFSGIASGKMLLAAIEWMTADCCSDTLAPAIACLNDTILNSDPGQCGATVSFDVTASDNCSGVTIGSVPPSGSFFSIGETVVWSIATDGSGNADTCSFTVMVTDVESPQIVCPDDIIRPNDPGQCGAEVTYPASASDNCAGATVESTPPSGSFFPVGATSVLCIATDASGNKDTCQFTVTVSDTEKPTSVCPPPIIVNNDPGQCGAVVSFSSIASDNCADVTSSVIPASGSMFPIGVTPVTFIAIDASGNGDTCVFTVTVVDSEPPVAICPNDTVVVVPRANGGVSVTFTSLAVDNCPGAVIANSPVSGSFFPFGITTVQSIATDQSGNSDTSTFAIEIDSLCVCTCHSDPLCDSVTDIVDVVAVINVAFRGGVILFDPDCTPERTDLNCSGSTDVIDVVKVINVAFRGANAATEYCEPCP